MTEPRTQLIKNFHDYTHKSVLEDDVPNDCLRYLVRKLADAIVYCQNCYSNDNQPTHVYDFDVRKLQSMFKDASEWLKRKELKR